MNKISLTIFNKGDFSVFIKKHQFKIAFGLFVAYLCLSLYKIGNNSLWYDECYSIDFANDSIRDIIKISLRDDVNPPLYLIILHYWLDLFGDSEASLRSLSALSLSFACSFFFLFSLRFFNWQTAVFSILLFFTSNELFYYSQEGRTYALVILFCVLSNFAFMSLVENPNWKNALLLGIFNSVIFYLHTLASLAFVGQLILMPFLTFNKHLFLKKNPTTISFAGYKLKHILYYIISWIIFGLLFLPWKARFFEIMSQKSKGYWFTTPSFDDLKNCLFDFSNSKELFFVYIFSFIILLFLIFSFKKLREESFNPKLIIIPIILGPLLLYLNYMISIYMAPMFIKRYVLFTILGFILTYAYVFSVLKVDFRIKSGLFLILLFFSARKMTVPRDSWYDFKDGVEFLKKVEGPRCYISSDMPALFAYYLDREAMFNVPLEKRYKLLAEHGIHIHNNLYWPNTIDYSKYSDIYYTRAFDNYYDPNHTVATQLRKKLLFVEEISIKGMQITHFKVPVNRDSTIILIRKDIINNKEWYSQIIKKAKERNITVDSMVTLDANWSYEQSYILKK